MTRPGDPGFCVTPGAAQHRFIREFCVTPGTAQPGLIREFASPNARKTHTGICVTGARALILNTLQIFHESVDRNSSCEPSVISVTTNHAQSRILRHERSAGPSRNLRHPPGTPTSFLGRRCEAVGKPYSNGENGRRENFSYGCAAGSGVCSIVARRTDCHCRRRRFQASGNRDSADDLRYISGADRPFHVWVWAEILENPSLEENLWSAGAIDEMLKADQYLA